MKLLKKSLAFILCLLTVLSFAGCHTKNEVAVTVDGVEFSSAYYLCALVFNDMNARSTLDASAKEGETVDYYKQKIEGKKFEKYVTDETVSYLKLVANCKNLCKENKIKLSEDEKNYAETMADYYWTSLGYSEVFEANGVSEKTFRQYMVDSYYSSAYFTHLYGKGGKKEINEEDLKKALNDNYILINSVSKALSELDDTAKATEKAKFEGYANDLSSGSKTFSEIYLSENTEDITESTEETKPADKYGSLIGTENTSYSSSYYNDVKAMAVGETKLITLSDNSSMAVITKKDISADSYYLTTLDTELRSILKSDEFNKDMEKKAEKLKADINKYATDRLSVKNITYPTAQ